jgi:hypothetical protein
MPRTSRLVGGCYVPTVRPLLDRHPDKPAREAQRRYPRAWANDRGELMRRDHARRGIEPPASFLWEMDLCPMYACDLGDEEIGPSRYEATVGWTPIDQACADCGFGEDVRISWDESCCAFAEGYDPSLRVELPFLRWRGEFLTRLRVVRL